MSDNAVLVINGGSSSVKFAVFRENAAQPDCYGQASGLGTAQASLTYTLNDNEHSDTLPSANHHCALEKILAGLDQAGVLQSIQAVGHRVVHGGHQATQAVVLSSDTRQRIEDNIEFAPLHNPANLAGIEACEQHSPTLPQVVVFDTAFHSTLPAIAHTYAVPVSWRQQLGVRRFGFHGINHHYIAETAGRILRSENLPSRIVSAHLGNGCSVCAIKDGKSVDTSMGFTPLEGLVMGSRCGDLDPGLAEYLCTKLDVNIETLTRQLNRDSGLLGVSGSSSDMRKVLQASAEGQTDATLAVELFCYRLAKYIASYLVPLGSIEMIVFSAGIGEHSAHVRQRTVQWLSALGFALDDTANHASPAKQQSIRNIAAAHSRPVYVIPANEEWMIAQLTFQQLLSL